MSAMDISRELQQYGREVYVRQNRAFHYQDDACVAAFYLLQGKVRPVKFSSGGKCFDLPLLGVGKWFGLAELMCCGTCLFDAVAAEECHALSFDKRHLELALRNANTAKEIIQALGNEIILAHRIIADDDALGKLLSFLLSRRSNAVAGSERSRIRTTQSEIAGALSLTRETINRQLKELETMGLVAITRGEIAIPDWERLIAFASERRG